MYQQQLTETRTRRQVEISELDGRLAEKYEAKLQEALQDLRDQYESQMANNRQEIELLYEQKIKNLQAANDRHQSSAAGALDELRQVRTRIDTLTTRIAELENQNAGLVARARDLEKLLEVSIGISEGIDKIHLMIYFFFFRMNVSVMQKTSHCWRKSFRDSGMR